MNETFTVETPEGVSVQDVTASVEEHIPTTVGRGLATITVSHTTAGVTVNEAEDGLLDDLEALMDQLVPADGGWRHDEVDDNAHAHLKSMLLGSSVTVPITAGGLDLGTWQSVLLFEGDGPRSRSVTVAVHASR